MTQGAVYDAINAITPKHHRPYLLKRRFSSKASTEVAAAATAAYLVLANIVSAVPASIDFPGRAGLLTSLATQYDAYLATVPDSPFKGQGISAGNAAAAAMIRGTGGRRTLRAVAVGPEPGSGALATAVAERDIAARS